MSAMYDLPLSGERSHVRFAKASFQGATDPLIGKTLNNRFKIESRIAHGGMGTVYRALQLPLNRMVALKVLNDKYIAADQEDFHRRFFLEASTAAQLRHPHSVTIFDYGCSEDGIYYIAMELLEGISLREVLLRCRRLSLHRSLRIAMQIVRALRKAHSLGVIHRDLKPANIFLQQDDDGRDFAKVLDFGLVKQTDTCDDITRTGQFLGSPGYMAPEQIRGGALDERCDVYALGAVLFEMLSGQPPFVREGAVQTMMAHVHDEVPWFRDIDAKLVVPRYLEEVIRRCLEKNPQHRWPDMKSLLEQLKQASRKLPEENDQMHALMPLEYEASGWAIVSSTGALRRPYLESEPTQDLTAKRPVEVQTGFSEIAETLIGDIDDVDFEPVAHQVERSPMQNEVNAWKREETVFLDPKALAAEEQAWRVAPRNKQTVVVKKSKRWSLGLLTILLALSIVNGFSKRSVPHATYALDLQSEPSGAMVFLKDKVICESTPCHIDWTGTAYQRHLCLRFVSDGYEDFILSRPISKNMQTFNVSMAEQQKQ